MKKRIIIILLILIALIIPFFMFNDTKASKKVSNIKVDKNIKKKNKYKVKSDNISEILEENVTEVIKENIIIIEREVKEYSKANKFKYLTNKYDNINEYIKVEEKEVEEIKYVCIKEDIFKEENGKKYYYENGNKVKGLKLINDIRYYFDFDTGELLKEDVKSAIDISSWQGNVDFEKVKNSGLVDFVIVRMGYGTTDTDDPVLDSKFKRNIEELKRLSIPFGIYLFGYAQNINASNKEVNFVEAYFNKYNIPNDTFIFYDAELTTFNNFYYSKPIYNMVIDNFVFKLNEKGYKNVGLYSNLHMLTKGSLSYEKKYPVWVAQYYNKCEYTEDYIGWQYTSDGKVEGIDGRVDMNIFY